MKQRKSNLDLAISAVYREIQNTPRPDRPLLQFDMIDVGSERFKQAKKTREEEIDRILLTMNRNNINNTNNKGKRKKGGGVTSKRKTSKKKKFHWVYTSQF
ncbi:MAG: hypothetical protein ACRCY4_09500 [Brevinema sp.]